MADYTYRDKNHLKFIDGISTKMDRSPDTAAATSATNAATSATNAATSATAAASSATTATTQASNASTSATSAASSSSTATDAVGAVAWKYIFDASTTMGDPTSGAIRFNHATSASVTNLAFDSVTSDSGNPDISDYIASIDDGTNTSHEGFVTIKKGGTPATFAVFAVTGAVTDNTSWLQVPVTHVSSNGSFSSSDVMYVNMTRSGNIGATGPTGPTGPAGGNEKADNVFRITDNGDDTKKIAFEASSIASSTVRTITMPNTDVTLVSSGGIVNADINASAAIAQSKLANIVNADVDASAAIAQSKLVDIVNADVDASAAIATSKLSGAVTSIASHGLGALATLASVDTGQIAADAVTGAKIEDDAIDSEHYVDGSIDNAHIADDAIDSEHYADGSIDEAHIADNQITLAKMAGGTDGNLITYDASGDPAYVTTGSAGEVLTSNGSGAAPTFQATAASLSWNSNITSTGKALVMGF